MVDELLRDIFAAHYRQVSIEQIQSVVAEHYKLSKAELLGDCKSRSVARPRQMAMVMARGLTSRSLPEIGRAFNRDHSTVLSACRKIKELRIENAEVDKDYIDLKRQLER